MRTIITRLAFILLLITGIKSAGLAQAVYNESFPKWRLGLNMGGTWQTNDVKKNYAGIAGGFNIERILNRKEDAPIGFSLGFRYLSGNSSGYDNNKNTGLQFNKALNGTNDSLVKYDSIPGYFYNNYFTHLAEGDLELKINFPAMEKRSRLIFHVFGGLGFNKYKTRIDALDKDGKMYDYSTLSANPSVGNIKSFYGSNFETLADRDGDGKPATLIFTPSVGLGLGFRLSKHVAFVFEHKVSFPFTNTLDGYQYTNTNSKLQGNDIYHYTSANLIFTIWGKHRNTSHHSNTNTTTNTNTNTNSNITANNQPKPLITVYSPSTNPYTSYTNVQQVTGTIQYVNSANNVVINVNGTQVTNYTFNPNNGSFSFGANLINGTNAVNITATNTAGQDNESLTINYTSQNQIVPVTNELPPNVQITYPANNYVTNVSSVNVNSTVTNVTNSSNIAISVNGYAISNFNFNSYNGSVSFVAPLVQGSNSIIVSAFNNAGNDAEQVFVTYNDRNQTNIVTPVEAKPVVSYNNPVNSPFESTTNKFNVTAHVTNVTNASQIAVQYNGLPVTNFTFNQYGFVNFTVNLNQGSNTVVITGTNTSGSDTKMATINFKEAGFPPVVTFINPAVNPTAVTTANTNVVATVTNVENQNNISVTVNNVSVPFTYNTGNHTVTIPAVLNTGNNSVSVSATTNFGNDTKTQIIERKDPQAKPIVTIINPSANPYSSSVNTIPVLAQVLNATIKQITVVNAANSPVQFTYNDVTQQVAFNANLNIGLNTYTVKATNQSGTDSKIVKIDYKETVGNVVLPKPSVTIVNPGVNPFVTSDAQVVVKASTTNVTSQQEVGVSVNGVNANFTFNPSNKEVEIPVTLAAGNNVVSVSVSNKGGTDSKTQVIEKIKQAVLLPVVTIINPQTSPYLSPTPTYTVSAEVLNVTGTGITVMQGQTPVVFNYDNGTHLLTFTANVATGGATFTVKGTNQAGSDSKSVTINHVRRVVGNNTPVEVNKPVVTISVPNAVNTTTISNTQSVTASVTYVANASQVSVLVNGVAKNDFVYNNGAVTFTSGLNLGNNTITITGTNLAGSDTKTVFVLYKKSADSGNGTVAADKPVVTFTTPNQLSTTTTSPLQNVNATVTNVTGSSQISVKLNGAPVNNFTFTNGIVAFDAYLTLGNNTVSITGTNAVGSDSKTISILYKKVADSGNGTVTADKPVVTFVTPGSVSTTVTSAMQNVTATVTNVTAASQISVKVNGTGVNNFLFNNGNVSFAASLIPGSNSISITGTNVVGSDSKSVTVLYSVKTAVVKPPVVTITTPAGANSNTSSSTQSVVATVTNVSDASQVQVTLNGANYSNFNYVSGSVTFNATLSLGLNTIVISGTNSAGTDSKQSQIIYAVPRVPAPVVTIVTPAPNTVVTAENQNVQATVTNVSSASQVQVTLNGSPINNFSFTNGTVSFTAALVQGNNTINVKGTNASGTDNKTVTVTRNVSTDPIRTVDPPLVTFIVPGSSVTTTTVSSQPVSATVTNVFQSQVSVKQNGNAITNFTFSNSTVSFTAQLNSGANTIEISGTNPQGSSTKSVTVNYTAPAANDPEIVICHYPPGNTNNPQQLTIPQSAWPAHQAHGDVLGTCPSTGGNNGNNGNNGTGNNGNGNNNSTNNDPMISICHYPPGNTNNPQQLTIPQSAWPAHQAHGDVLGTCPATGSNNNGNNGSGNNGNGNNNSNSNNSDPMISICHYPPGNTNNPQQIEIPASAWPAHQAHGDVLGACPPSKNVNGNGNNNNGNGGRTNTSNNNGGNNNSGSGIVPKTNNSTPLNNQNSGPKKVETTPKTTTTTTPKKVEATTSTPKTVDPVKEEKKKEETNNTSPAPRTIKPR